MHKHTGKENVYTHKKNHKEHTHTHSHTNTSRHPQERKFQGRETGDRNPKLTRTDHMALLGALQAYPGKKFGSYILQTVAAIKIGNGMHGFK